MALTPLQFGFGVPGGMEMAVILLIAILLFGANKIPKLARSTGQAIGEFRRGREEIEQELQELQEEADPTASPSSDDSGSESSSGDEETADAQSQAESDSESTDETDESK